MLKGLVKKFKSAVDDTEEIDEKFFAQVMKEIKDGYKEEGLEGKSIAMSGGDTDKANSIYMQLRAEYLQNKEVLDHIRAIQKEEIRKEKELKKEQERLDNDELYQVLRNFGIYDLLKLFQKEIEDLGYQKVAFFSQYYFKKGSHKYYATLQPEEKKVIIYEYNLSSSPETTFNLDDKSDEIIAFARNKLW